MKGYVDLSKVKVIEKVLDGAFDKPSFQVSHCAYVWGRGGEGVPLLLLRIFRVSVSWCFPRSTMAALALFV